MMAGLSPVIVRWSKGWFILLPKVLYVDTETLSIALRAHPLFFNDPSRQRRWTETASAVIGPLTSFTESLFRFDFAPYLLCTLFTSYLVYFANQGPIKHQLRFENLWKFIYNTIYMASSQHIRSIGR